MDALRTILEGTASETGERFFNALVENLARALGTHGAWVTEYFPESRSLRALAFRLGDRFVEGYEHSIDGTPCQGVIERAVITAQGGELNLDRALPASSVFASEFIPPLNASGGTDELLTQGDLERIERNNLVRALERTSWQVAGESGAARLLGMAPSTFASRMKALGIRRQN